MRTGALALAVMLSIVASPRRLQDVVLGSPHAVHAVVHGAAQPARPADGNATLTAVAGLKVGHFTLAERPTGCTVILAEAGVTAGVDVRGAAPATAEVELLRPVNLVPPIHAVTLSGGSAYGLDSRTGVMRYLDEKNIGFKAYGGTVNVPIVPAASLIDLIVGGSQKIRPTADCGYRAAQAA